MKKSTIIKRIKLTIWKILTISTLAAVALSPIQTHAQTTRKPQARIVYEGGAYYLDELESFYEGLQKLSKNQ